LRRSHAQDAYRTASHTGYGPKEATPRHLHGAITFHLNKQAAYVGKVNFSNEAPLGPITVRIVADPETIIDYLAPSTIGEGTAQNASIPDNNEGYHEMEKN
jgi:predicted RNA binding protein with dsRBD fold (UPF0201 family)